MKNLKIIIIIIKSQIGYLDKFVISNKTNVFFVQDNILNY